MFINTKCRLSGFWSGTMIDRKATRDIGSLDPQSAIWDDNGKNLEPWLNPLESFYIFRKFVIQNIYCFSFQYACGLPRQNDKFWKYVLGVVFDSSQCFTFAENVGLGTDIWINNICAKLNFLRVRISCFLYVWQ